MLDSFQPQARFGKWRHRGSSIDTILTWRTSLGVDGAGVTAPETPDAMVPGLVLEALAYLRFPDGVTLRGATLTI